jgi:hypothetical protein
MLGQMTQNEVIPAVPAGSTETCLTLDQLGDTRFARLLGRAPWQQLPAAVRARFSHRFGPGVAVTYAGIVETCRKSPLGWLLTQLCRCIGAPLPLSDATGLSAIVTVTEEPGGEGQVWSRIYARPSGFPQVIHSAKRFAGETGLEEYLGGGLGIALRVEADETSIIFRSDHYFFIARAYRWKLPRWLEPGAMTVTHRELGGGAFGFMLDLRHPWFGELIHQHCRFHDQETVH